MDYFELAKEICYSNRFQRFLEKPEIERIVVGKKVDSVDKLKVKEYGGTHYIYEEGKNEQ